MHAAGGGGHRNWAKGKMSTRNEKIRAMFLSGSIELCTTNPFHPVAAVVAAAAEHARRGGKYSRDVGRIFCLWVATRWVNVTLVSVRVTGNIFKAFTYYSVPGSRVCSNSAWSFLGRWCMLLLAMAFISQ